VKLCSYAVHCNLTLTLSLERRGNQRVDWAVLRSNRRTHGLTVSWVVFGNQRAEVGGSGVIVRCSLTVCHLFDT